MDFVASFLEGHDELLVALGDVPATMDNNNGGLGGGHGSWRFFFFFFCVQNARVRNLGILKKIFKGLQTAVKGGEE